jgi:hypothetical protein
MKQTGEQVVATNRQARHRYTLGDTFESQLKNAIAKRGGSREKILAYLEALIDNNDQRKRSSNANKQPTKPDGIGAEQHD